MAIINKGTAFSNGEQLSANKLNSLVDGATFGTDSVDNASTIVNANGAITVRDSGVTAAKLATGAVTDAKLAAGAVTTAKILDDNVTFAKLTDVIDDDTMATATDSTLATSESIKAYVDGGGGFTPSTYAGEESVTLPNGLIMKFGVATGPTSQTAITITFADAFPNGIISAQATATNTSAGNGSTYDYWYQIVNQSLNTSVSIMPQGASAEPPAHNVNWQAIGY